MAKVNYETIMAKIAKRNPRNPKTRELERNKFGLKEDPRGLDVVASYKGRELLGRIKDIETRNLAGGGRSLRLIVYFFNGERWPFDPAPNQVKVLVRTYS